MHGRFAIMMWALIHQIDSMSWISLYSKVGLPDEGSSVSEASAASGGAMGPSERASMLNLRTRP